MGFLSNVMGFGKENNPFSMFGGEGGLSNPLGGIMGGGEDGGGGFMDKLNPMNMFGGGEGGGGFMDMLNPMSMFGGGGDGGGIFGSKPKTPEYPTGRQIMDEALGTNIGVLPRAKELAAEINAYNQDSLSKSLRNIFGSEAIDETPKEISKILQQRIRGDIGDLERLTFDQGAARALGGGYAGTGMDANLRARDLGLTQYEVSQRAIDSFERWLTVGRAQLAAPIFDVGNFQLTVPQQIGLSDARFQRDLYAANVAAAPDPAARGAFDATMSVLGMALGAYSGGPGYQGTYRPNYGSVGGYGGGGGMAPNGFNYFGGTPVQYYNDFVNPNIGYDYTPEPTIPTQSGGGGGLGGLVGMIA